MNFAAPANTEIGIAVGAPVGAGESLIDALIWWRVDAALSLRAAASSLKVV
jgi:hypothetical protein